MEVKNEEKLLNCLLPLACLATVSVSCGSSAQAAVLGDDYPSSWKYGGFGVDPWTMYWRQCTSFAAYRLSNTNGFTLPVGYGNAITWGSIARANGHRVDMNPAVGSIALGSQLVSMEQVTWDMSPWVAEVRGDQVTIEEYNYDAGQGPEKYHKRSFHKSQVSGYIHLKTSNQELKMEILLTLLSKLVIQSASQEPSVSRLYQEIPSPVKI